MTSINNASTRFSYYLTFDMHCEHNKVQHVEGGSMSFSNINLFMLIQSVLAVLSSPYFVTFLATAI